MKLRVLCLLVATMFVALAAGQEVRIGKEGEEGVKQTPISVSGYSGEVDSILRFDLSVAGFKFVPNDQANYHLTGANATQVEGRLLDGTKSLLAKAYAGGTPRSEAHALADDIVQAVFGVPGIARTKIVFKRDLGKTSEVYVSDYDGFNPVAVTADKSIVASPTWGPGHKMLYYMSYRAVYADIYSHDLTTGERKKFADYPGSNMSPAVSRDGRKVAFVSSKTGSPDIYVADASGSNLQQLTKTKDAESSPTWSPDGSKICYALDEARALYVIPSTGGAPRRLRTDGSGRPTEPDWSPDGKTIIFTSQVAAGFSLWTVPADGSAAPTQLVTGEDASWAPNSRTVVFVRRVGGKRVLSLLDVPSKTVKSIPSNLGSCSQPCWSR
jgi:TolB protein